MPNIKNKRYRQFLDTGEIDFITMDHLDKALSNASKHQKPKEARALLITLFYTGARPVEILQIMGKDISKEKNDIKIYIRAAKHGVPRTLRIPLHKKHVKEIYKYLSNVFPEVVAFPTFISSYTRTYATKQGNIKHINETSAKIRYWINKWFNFLGDSRPNVYFLRHNRFSLFSEKGASPREIKFLKGARDLRSVQAYDHISTLQAKKLRKFY